ncbi:hypothetical protein TNCV_4366851 [Trichonephila clavipes]|nr:hypothetical protein TNCV_4366851 [Trichonephila clavipes]
MPVSCSFEHHTGDCVIWLDSTPILRENILEVVKAFHQPHKRTCGWTAPGCKGTIRLQTFMPSLGFKPRPNSSVVSITNATPDAWQTYFQESFLNFEVGGGKIKSFNYNRNLEY